MRGDLRTARAALYSAAWSLGLKPRPLPVIRYWPAAVLLWLANKLMLSLIRLIA